MDSAKQQRKQAIRLRRTVMGLAAYACTLSLVLASWLTGLMPGWVAALYLGMVIVANAVFLGLILSGLNLRLSRPDMTVEQILSSIIPGLFAIYFTESPQARAAFLLLGLVPMIFGFLGLTTRRSLVVGFTIYGAFLVTFALLFVYAPQRIDPVGDGILMFSFFFAVLQVSLMGGYVNGLHRALSSANQQLKKAVDTIAELANRDELTGIFNRRYLLTAVQAESERSNRGREHFALAIIDVDHFKAINDDFGHDVGDRVLIRIVRMIDAGTRKLDHFGRFGGEEFLLIMPQTTLEGALCKVEQLRGLVAGLDFTEDGCSRPVTFSAGVAAFVPGEQGAETIKRADTALYAAKDHGRNCVVPAEAPAGLPRPTSVPG